MLKKSPQNEESSTGGAPTSSSPDKAGTELDRMHESEFESLLQAAASPLYDRTSNNRVLQRVIDETDFKDLQCWPGVHTECSPPVGGRRGEGGGRRRSRQDSSGNSAASRTTQGGSLQNLHGKLDGGRKLHKSGSLTTFAHAGCEEFMQVRAYLTAPHFPYASPASTASSKTKVRTRTHSHNSDARDCASGSAINEDDGVGHSDQEVDGSATSSRDNDITVLAQSSPGSAEARTGCRNAWQTIICDGSSFHLVSDEPDAATTAATSQVKVGADDSYKVDTKISLPLMLRSGTHASRSEASDSGLMMTHSCIENCLTSDGSKVENSHQGAYELPAVDDNNVGLVGGGGPQLLASTLNEQTRRGLTKSGDSVHGSGSATRSLDENGNPMIIMQQESLQQQAAHVRNANHYHQTVINHEVEGPGGGYSIGETLVHRTRRIKKTRISARQREMRSEDIDGHVGAMDLDDLVKLINATDDDPDAGETTSKKKSSAREREPNRPPIAARTKKALSGGVRDVARKNLENDACSLNGARDSTAGATLTAKSDVSPPSSSRETETIATAAGTDKQVDRKLPPAADTIAGWGMCATGNEKPNRRPNQPRKRSDSFTLGDGQRPAAEVVHLGRVRSPEQQRRQQLVDKRPNTPPSRPSDDGVAAATTTRNRGATSVALPPPTAPPNLEASSMPPPSGDVDASVSSFAADFYAVADVPPPVEEPEFCEVRKKKKRQQQQQRQALGARFSSNTGYYRNTRFNNSGSYGGGGGGGGSGGSGGGNASYCSSTSSNYEEGSRYGGGGAGRPPSWNELSLTSHHHHHRGARGGSEDIRRKSTSSVPPSEPSSADNSDVESVHSLPVSSTSPRQVVSKTSASSSCTPQASYADIAKMTTAAAAATRKSFGTSSAASVASSSAATSPLPPVVSETKRDACTSTHSEGQGEDIERDFSPTGDTDRASPVGESKVSPAAEPVKGKADVKMSNAPSDDSASESAPVLAETDAKVATYSAEVEASPCAEVVAAPSRLQPSVKNDLHGSPMSDGAVIAVVRLAVERKQLESVCTSGGCCDDNPEAATALPPPTDDPRDSAVGLSLRSDTSASPRSVGSSNTSAWGAHPAAIDVRPHSIDSCLTSTGSSFGHSHQQPVVIFLGSMHHQLSDSNPADDEAGGITFGFEINEQLLRQTAHDMRIPCAPAWTDTGEVAFPVASETSSTLVTSTPLEGTPTKDVCQFCEGGETANASPGVDQGTTQRAAVAGPVSSAGSYDFGQLVLLSESAKVVETTRSERRLLENELHNFNHLNVVDYIAQAWVVVQEQMDRVTTKDDRKTTHEISATDGGGQK